MGVNLHKIVGIRLDDTSKQGLMHEYIDKRAKMQRNKESQTGAQSKQGKHNIAQSGERVCIKQTNITRCVPSSGYNQTSHKQDECNHKQASGPRDQQA